MQPKARFPVLKKIGLMILLMAVMTSAACAAPGDEGRLYLIKTGKLAGFIDINGTEVIPPQFSDANHFSEGLAPAQEVDSGKWGYIDRTGSFIIPPQFKYAFPFSEGLAEVWFDPSGEGYIDDTGQVIINGSGGFVRDGLIRIRAKDKTIFADKSGSVLFEVPYDAYQVGGGLIAFNLDNAKMGFMDRQGKVVIQPVYHRTLYWADRQFAERITAVGGGSYDKRKYGFIDKSGRTVVDFQFDWAEQFFDGLAMVAKEHKYGYINTAGEVAIPMQFDEADHFSEGLAAVLVGDRWGFIDTQGRMVIAPQYLSRVWGNPMIFSEGLAAVRTETGTGFINKAGEMVVPAIYRSAEEFSGGLALVYPFAYVNRQGEVVWPRQ